ncbi:hypothetical protein BpHYR1_003878 [Brachionus plicatilis]|uniref:Uncharacterized protein n=1 Tax=Brachionus plicatilis TaxID=10195 RepID=A0A3M7Q786_BRAPC|nr:hypothetical protein BpHYR1_003878 [Brachionus plicatilis]
MVRFCQIFIFLCYTHELNLKFRYVYYAFRFPELHGMWDNPYRMPYILKHKTKFDLFYSKTISNNNSYIILICFYTGFECKSILARSLNLKLFFSVFSRFFPLTVAGFILIGKKYNLHL